MDLGRQRPLVARCSRPSAPHGRRATLKGPSVITTPISHPGRRSPLPPMGWTSDEDEQPQPEPRRAGSPTKWWEAPQPYEAPPPPWVQDAQTFKRRRPRPDARQDASVRCDAPGRALDDESDADDDELRLNTILNKFGQPSPSERAAAAVTPDECVEDAWASPRPRTDSLPRTPTRRKAAFSSQTTAFAKRRRRVSFSLKTFDASDVTDLVARMQPPASPPRVPFWRANLEE